MTNKLLFEMLDEYAALTKEKDTYYAFAPILIKVLTALEKQGKVKEVEGDNEYGIKKYIKVK